MIFESSPSSSPNSDREVTQLGMGQLKGLYLGESISIIFIILEEQGGFKMKGQFGYPVEVLSSLFFHWAKAWVSQPLLRKHLNLLAQGKKLYEQNCMPCHGPKGDGKGPAGALLKPPPRDFDSLLINGLIPREISKRFLMSSQREFPIQQW